MIRDVNLVSYLPPFMMEYEEPVAALEAENHEFQIIWRAVDRVLYNRFIDTADEYGISRFEQMLGIYPSAEDSLEDRRTRVQSKWFQTIPYTMRMLIKNLFILCKGNDFAIVGDFQNGYTLHIGTKLETFAQVEELDNLISTVIPCNIKVDSKNTVCGICEGDGRLIACMSVAEVITITNK